MNINYQSDFKIIERLMPDAPFRFTYYVAKDKGSVTAEYDGQSYSGCFVDGDRLIVPVDGGTLGIGNVRVKREYFLDDKAFADGVCDLVSVEGTDIELGRGRTDSDIEADVEVVVPYKTFTFDDMTEEQKQEIADRVPTKEAEREKAEAQRAEAEKGRAAAEAARQATFTTNEEARQSVFNANEEKREEAEALREERTEEAIASIANKVDRTDNAPELTAGFAGNLVGRGEATSEEIGFRPSGGLTSVNDGAARIERLKGNTLVWNQKCDTPRLSVYVAAVNNITINNDGEKVEVTNTAYEGDSGDSIAVYRVDDNNRTVIGHKILCILAFQSSSTNILGPSIEYGSYTHNLKQINQNTYYLIYTTTMATGLLLLKAFGTKAIGDTWSFSNIQVHDLTQMFGAGNEPTTIEEFNARKPIGIDEYAYNEGELISTTADEIKSVGFNAWDEEWEIGSIINGEDNPYSGHFRSKNYIPVLPNTDYFFKSNGTLFLSWYDEEYNYIPLGNLSASNGVKKSPENARYLRFYAYNETTYNHDICIHLVHTGYRNGEYEPYEEFRRSLPISEIKDSEGNQLFPNGLLSAGSVYDEITATKAIKRIGVVDMGTLDWGYSSKYKTFNTSPSSALTDVVPQEGVINILSSMYLRGTSPSNTYLGKDDNMTISINATGRIYIRNDFYTDFATFKAAMSGVMLYYELAEPIEVDLPEPINMDYEVSDFGTEEVISDTPTTPLKADIIYQFNAVDRIRENSLSLEDLIKRVAALEAQNAALVQQLNATNYEQTE